MKRFTLATISLVLALALAGCNEPTARDKNVAVQHSLMATAVAKFPAPQPSNFPAREAVVKQTKRMDEAGKVFYVYLVGMNGQQIGYYVSNTRPVATCSLLTPPEDIITHSQTYFQVKAPSMGGTYSPAPSCGSVFFFDALTDAYIEISGMTYFVSDQPLSLKSEPITVVTQNK